MKATIDTRPKLLKISNISNPIRYNIQQVAAVIIKDINNFSILFFPPLIYVLSIAS